MPRFLAGALFALFLPVLMTVLGPGWAQEICSDNPWEREMAVGLAVDQEQVKEGLLGGTAVGQVFTPTQPRLERVDVILKNRADHTPGRIRLLKWAGNYAETVKQPALWEDDADFSGADQPVLRHYFPRVAVEPGQAYLLEVLRPSEAFYAGGVQEDAYPGGFALTSGGERRGWDLWFWTFGKAEGAGQTPAPPRPLPLPEMPAVQPQPPRAPIPLSKDVYLSTLRTHAERNVENWAGQGGRRIAELMYYTGFLYKYAGDQRWLGEVSQWLGEGAAYIQQENAGDSPWFGTEMGFGILWLRGNPRWTAQDEANARQIMLTSARRMARHLERGAMNRAMWDVLVMRLAADLYPDAEEAPAWRQWSDTAWRDFADYEDTEEDSAHYNAVFTFFMLGYLHLTGQLDLLRQPRMQAWVARYRDVLAPNGMMPGWGDSMGMGGDWGAWAALFETAATVNRDGTCKEAARRVVQSHWRYLLAEEPLFCVYEDMQSLVWAYVGADDSVEPTPLGGKSGVFTCAYPRLRPKAERQAGWFALEGRQTPWKMVLRSSAEETAYYALFGLLPYGGHGHADAPALLALAANGTLLLHDSTYMDRRWQDHNLLFGVRVSGGNLGQEPSETVVREFSDGQAAAYADIAWQDYPGWGMGFARQVLFVKGLGWLIHDRTEAKEAAEWFLGPMWQVDRMRERGENWFDIDYPQPNSFAWPIANGTDHLLIWFAPKAGASVDWADMSRRVQPGKPWYSSAPWCVYQCAGPLAVSAERPAWFTSLLLPLAREKAASEAAQAVRAVADEPGATVLEVREGAVKWTLAVINDGKAHVVGPFTVEAKAAVVREAPGQEPAVAAFGAKAVTAGNRNLLRSETPRHFEVGW